MSGVSDPSAISQLHRRRAALSLAALGVVTTLATSSTVSARDDDRGRPWARGTTTIGLALGGARSRDLMYLGASISTAYYVFNGVAVGLEIDETYLAWRPSVRSRVPELDEVPNNIFSATPTMRFVPFRSHRFSPFVMAGVGPMMLNHGGGTIGHWVIMPGATFGLGSNAYLGVGVRFSDDFPAGKCEDAFRYESPDGVVVEIEGVCGFRWAPQLGVGFAF